MTYKEYVEKCQKLLEERPELANVLVVYSGDDEGNDFQKVFYEPQAGHFEEITHGRGDFFLESDEIEDYPVNAVCIN